ncbi:hypothetical protein M4D55_10005 [Metabacillus idriensis]|uniref:hypothetical protein n=1 Tax=Metabacillus idriensis TaxID=324768 RepID=UPI0020418E71|nr:hypothetical protein [Metabacillus idriensis]MCM3596107.1 hypothetical protein [Metabacillus idriensis]
MFKQHLNTPFKKTLAFFMIYLALLGWMIFMAVHFTSVKDNKDSTLQFTEELKKYEEKEKLKEKKTLLFEVSNETAILAVTAGSIADIVIVLLWARRENLKNETNGITAEKSRWRDKKWFWNIVAMGVVQPKNNRIVVNWKNMILMVIIIHILVIFLVRTINA